ncbi:unnamed protein product [Meloidogyne enterolobii]|uniref:Uncharacterized protein n=1 Tax=Meloidogyne enterolobii TaxID=390850 RepID=A0ACB0YLB0_MELEN
MSKQKQLTLEECWSKDKQKNIDKNNQTDDILTDICPWYFFHARQGSTDIKNGLFRNQRTGEIILPGIDRIPKVNSILIKILINFYIKTFWICMTGEQVKIFSKIEDMKKEAEDEELVNETIIDSGASSPIHNWTNDETPASPAPSPDVPMYYI